MLLLAIRQILTELRDQEIVKVRTSRHAESLQILLHKPLIEHIILTMGPYEIRLGIRGSRRAYSVSTTPPYIRLIGLLELDDLVLPSRDKSAQN